jgi:hypothetical protein
VTGLTEPDGYDLVVFVHGSLTGRFDHTKYLQT